MQAGKRSPYSKSSRKRKKCMVITMSLSGVAVVAGLLVLGYFLWPGT